MKLARANHRFFPLQIPAQAAQLETMANLSEFELDRVRSSVFFGSLPPLVLDGLLNSSRLVTLQAEQSLFVQGQRANAVFAVVEGLIKLTVEKPDGNEVLVETFHAGMSFAEALAFGNKVYPVSATALVDSKVLIAPSEVVQIEVRNNPEAASAILAATYQHLHGLVRQIEELKGNSGTERLARYILARVGASNENAEIEIPFDKRVLASLLGMKPESLSRAFRRLAEFGVSSQRRVIRVSAPRALQDYLEPK